MLASAILLALLSLLLSRLYTQDFCSYSRDCSTMLAQAILNAAIAAEFVHLLYDVADFWSEQESTNL
jgi:hypothetical protein